MSNPNIACFMLANKSSIRHKNPLFFHANYVCGFDEAMFYDFTMQEQFAVLGKQMVT